MIAPLVLTYFVDAPSWDDCRGEAALLNLSLPGLLEAELVPEVTSLGLALALYSACLATVFGNTLVIVAVVKVRRDRCAEPWGFGFIPNSFANNFFQTLGLYRTEKMYLN